MTRTGTHGCNPNRDTPSRAGARGFSLIEVAVVMFIIVLLVGSIFVPLTTQVEQRQVNDTQKMLDEIRDALLGFAVVNGHLPCPDTSGNGNENLQSGNTQCAGHSLGIAVGRLPHRTLGLANSDVWGNRLTYVINEQFGRRSPPMLTLSTTGTDIRVCTTQSCGTIVTDAAIAAVVSHGRNGYGAINLATGAQNPAAPHVDERENYDTDRDIVSRTHSATGASAGEFDDVVTWLSRFTLFNRMVAAGKLP